MRPFTTSHATANNILRYLSKGGQLLSGSLPVSTLRQAKAALRSFEEPNGYGLLHITLSMPQGHRLTDDVWFDLTDVVLSGMGIPSNLVPWLSWGREDTHCDHIHIVSGKQTFTGRKLDISTSVLNTDRIDRDLRARLSIPELPWRHDPQLILSPNIPVQIFSEHPEAAQFASELGAVMKADRPASLAEVNMAMFRRESPYWLVPAPDGCGLLTPTNLITGQTFNPKIAGAAFSSKLILARIKLAARFRVLAISVLLRKVAQLAQNYIPISQNNTGKYHDNTSFGPRPDAPQDRSDTRRRTVIAPPTPIDRSRAGRSNAKIHRETHHILDGGRKTVGEPDDYPEPPHENDSYVRSADAGHRKGPEISGRRARTRGRRVKAIYQAAKMSGFPMRHRFVANGSAIMLHGARGEVAIFDLYDGTFISSSEDGPAAWNDYFHALTRFTDCQPSSIVVTLETGTEHLPEWRGEL